MVVEGELGNKSQKQLKVDDDDVFPERPQVVPSDPSRTGVLVHSALPVEPCSSLDDAPLVDSLRRVRFISDYFHVKIIKI